jgi:hypothetical protein
MPQCRNPFRARIPESDVTDAIGVTTHFVAVAVPLS